MPVTFPGCYEDTSFYPNFLRGYNDVYYNVHSGSPVRFCFLIADGVMPVSSLKHVHLLKKYDIFDNYLKLITLLLKNERIITKISGIVLTFCPFGYTMV